MAKKKNSFSGSLGFVLAAAGSAVGVGNIWRFPYLCAKDGGGLFLLVYLILVATFGFVLLTTDMAIGRRTKENALRAFGTLHPKWKFVGYLTFLVPMLIMTYYSVIGGWITKYFFEYLTTSGRDVAEDGYFTSFITEKNAPLIFTGIFLALTIWVVYRGLMGRNNIRACQDPVSHRNRDFFTDAFLHGRGWDGPDGNTGIPRLRAPGFYGTDGKRISGSTAGCDEPALFLTECVDGNYGNIWFLCQR